MTYAGLVKMRLLETHVQYGFATCRSCNLSRSFLLHAHGCLHTVTSIREAFHSPRVKQQHETANTLVHSYGRDPSLSVSQVVLEVEGVATAAGWRARDEFKFAERSS